MLELTLDNERNRIARLELFLSMAALALAASACVSGFFGMNLVSGYATNTSHSCSSRITVMVRSRMSDLRSLDGGTCPRRLCLRLGILRNESGLGIRNYYPSYCY